MSFDAGRVYADVVINNMASAEGSGTGTGGTAWDGTASDFPGVPYSGYDVNACSGTIGSDWDAEGVRGRM